MGAWGPGVFENDDALDWVDEFDRAQDKLHLIETALATAISTAEVVAALNRRPSGSLPDSLKDWSDSRDQGLGEKLLELSRQAISAIAADSELKDLWEEGGPDYAKPWYDAVGDLASRVPEKGP